MFILANIIWNTRIHISLQAFLILADLLVLAAFVLLLLQNYSDLTGKLVQTITIVLLIAEGIYDYISVCFIHSSIWFLKNSHAKVLSLVQYCLEFVK